MAFPVKLLLTCAFPFFICPLCDAADNKHGIEKKEQKQLSVFHQGFDDGLVRELGLVYQV